MRSGKPTVIAWLETGTRAYMGLRDVSIAKGNLIVTVNDPEKAITDCCSAGSITYWYKYNGKSFQPVAAPVFRDTKKTWENRGQR